ncbi:MAG TPA: hypothetical protein VG317_01130 [Pseudonocardiaceae bacterium]|nr:hypothetical protein [Pseudonocardiaceae bacterium]
MAASSRRVSVTLDSTDQAVLDAFVAPDRAEHATLEAWAAEHGMSVRDSSESSVIRVLAQAGAMALRDAALERGYAKLAADITDEDRAERRTRHQRYAERVDRRYAE